jgi:hypothetical protein
MSRVKIGTAGPSQKAIEDEIARLRGLDLMMLRKRWRTVFRRAAPDHLPRHLLFKMIAYRIQANHFGDLEPKYQRLLDEAPTPEAAGRRAIEASNKATVLKPGTILAREWNGSMHRVTVMADGFAWNGRTYESLSKIAFVITGTRWNGPRFFGLRDKKPNGSARRENRPS